MKILFIAPYRQADDWGDSSRNYILALQRTGHDITLRPLLLGNILVPDLNEDIQALEKKKYSFYDVVIQKTLPYALTYHHKCHKNIGLCVAESFNLQHMHWQRYMNTMDEIWTVSQHQTEIFKSSGVVAPIKIVGAPIDDSIFSKVYESLNINELNNHFVFYYIGELSERTNLKALIIAFHSEFHYTEPVRLVLCGNFQQQHIGELINNIKKDLRIYPHEDKYKKDIVISPNITSQQEGSLHTFGHCFILPSYGEAFQRHTINAVGFNNFVLTGNHSGMQEFVPNKNWLIQSQPMISYIKTPPIQYLYNGEEYWYEISTIDLANKMRRIYEYRNSSCEKTCDGLSFILNKCSYQTIANNINSLLT